MTLVVRLLGVPSARVDDAPLEVDTRKAVALLAFLAVEQEPQPREQILDLLWPDAPPDRARSTLRRTLSALRAALGRRWVHADRHLITFDGSDVRLDLRELQDTVAQHDHESCPTCAPDLRTALAAVRGGFMEGFSMRNAAQFERWQLETGEHVRRLVDRASALLFTSLMRSGEHASAAAVARRRVTADPLREDASRDLMCALARAGDRSGAVAVYRELVATLERELGVPPLEETTAVYQAVLRDPAPAVNGPPKPSSTPVLQVRPTSPAATTAAATAQPTVPFVGRREELERVLERLRTPHGTAIVDASMGMGVSRLLAEAAAALRDDGARVLRATATRAAAPVPYAVLQQACGPMLREPTTTSALREASRIELSRVFSEVRPPGAERSSTRAAFLGALETLLRTQSFPTLIVDDAQWMDAATAQALSWLLAVADLDLRVLLGISGDARRSDRAVTAVTAQLRERAVRVTLGPLADDDVIAMLGDRDFARPEQLSAWTGGVPLFIMEALRLLKAGDAPSEETISEDLRAIIEARVDGLSSAARQVIDAVAVLDGPARPALIGRVSARTMEETDLALEELVSAGLVQDDGEVVRAANEQIAMIVLQRHAAARRRLLHRRAAESLASSGNPIAVQVARHHQAAGEDEQAAAWFAAAGEAAARMLAHTEVIAAYQAALAAGHPERARLHLAIGDAATFAGRYDTAVEEYEAALALGGPDPTVEHRLGRVHRRLRHWDLAAAHLRRADDPDRADSRLLAVVAADLAVVEHQRGHREQAASCVQRALRLSAAGADSDARARAENAAALVADSRTARESHLRAALAAAGRDEDRVAVLNNLAATITDRDEAVRLAEQACLLAERTGDRHLLAVVSNTLADCEHRAGDKVASRRALTQAVKLFADVTTIDGELDPAVWMLHEL